MRDRRAFLTFPALLVLAAGGCAAGARTRAPASRPALGPGTESIVAAPGGPVGLCEPRDGPTRVCGWAPAAQVERWLGDVERLMREPARLQARSTPDLRLSDSVTVHVTRNGAGAERPYQLVFADDRRHLARGAPLTTDAGADFLVRLRDAVARARSH